MMRANSGHQLSDFFLTIRRKFWNSPGFTGLLNKLTSPLRLLLLTPLVLRLPEFEIGVFGLLSTGVILLNLVNGAITNAFTVILSYAFGGVSDLRPLQHGETRESTGSPNWDIFRRALQTMFRLQLLIGFPLLIVGAISIAAGIGNLTGWSQDTNRFWTPWLIFSVNQALLLLMSRYEAALLASGLIAAANRLSLFFTIASILLGALTIFLTSSLLWLVVVQAAIAFSQRAAVTKMARREIPGLKEEGLFETRFDREIAKSSFKPIWKGTLSVFSGYGLRAIVAVYIASLTSVWGASSVISLNFSLNLLLTIAGFSAVPLQSKIPLLAKNYICGEMDQLRSRVWRSLAITLFIFLVVSIMVGVVGPIGLIMLGANIELIGPSLWFVAAILYGLCTISGCFELVCNLDNQVQFLTHNVVAAVFVCTALFLINDNLTPLHVILLNTLPYLVFKSGFVLNVFRKRMIFPSLKSSKFA